MNHKKIHLEILRIFAIILVVFNHTPAFLAPLTPPVESSFTEYLMLCASIADKVAVPLFFMISGALLLPKQESLRKLFKNRFLRIFIVLLSFILIQNVLFLFAGKLTTKRALVNILSGHTPASVTWFLYGYLAFILMLPFLRLLVEKMETKHFLYLLILHFVIVEFLPYPHTPLDAWLPFTAHNGSLSNIYIYALMGYYMENRISLSALSRKVLLILASSSVLSILIGALLTILPLIVYGKVPSQMNACFTGAILIPCIFIYACCRKVGGIRLPMWLTNLITLLGPACFTVMLTENIFRITIAHYIPRYYTHYCFSILVTLLVCCCGWICGIIAKRIPVIKTFI